MRKLLLGVVLSLAVAGAESAHAWGFGSIAFSPATGRYGWAVNTASAWNAAQAAVYNCGAFDCRAVVHVQNGCAALSVGWNQGFGTALGYNQWQAVNNAQYSCSRFTTGCQPYAWVCAPGF